MVEPLSGDLEKVALSMKRKKPRENCGGFALERIPLKRERVRCGTGAGECVRWRRLRRRLLCGLRHYSSILGVGSERVFRPVLSLLRFRVYCGFVGGWKVVVV